MPSAGLQKLTRPNWQVARAMRIWGGCSAVLVAVVLLVMAGRTNIEPQFPMLVQNVVDQPASVSLNDRFGDETEAPSLSISAARASHLQLRPALPPKQRTSRQRSRESRNAGLAIEAPSRRF